MKILNVINSLDERAGGGATERVFQMSRHLANMGHEVAILTTDCHLTQERIESVYPAKVIALPCLILRFFVPVPAFFRVASIVRESDVLHLVNHWTVINVLAYFAAVKYGKPYIVCPLGALPIFGRSKILKKFFNFVVGKRLIQRANAHIAASLVELPAFGEYGVPSSAVTHIPNGINNEDYVLHDDDAFLKRENLLEIPYILFMGRLNLIKGPDLLLRAFAELSGKFDNYHLAFIGNDEGLGDRLLALAAEFSLKDRIHFLGFVGREEKALLIHSCKLLVVPSRLEAMSIVVLEAGVVGKPVLITDQCGFDEVADVNGGRVVPATVDGLRDGLSQLLADPEQLVEKGIHLRRFVEENYLWTSIVKRYDLLFRQACTATGAPEGR
jgi:glycosyltransferase involved in cell wall biosynthesis